MNKLKDIVPIQQERDLKELGFNFENEHCYLKQKLSLFQVEEPYNTFDLILFSQAFRWFREKYDLEGVTQKADSIFNWYKYCIWRYTDDGKVRIENAFDMEIKSYEEAEQACLDKLIEIIKKQNDGKY